MEKTSLRERITKNLAGVVLGGMIALAPMGYATAGGLFGNHGELKADKAVTENFENYKLKSDHKYFVAKDDEGSHIAILGMEQDYELGNTMNWEALNPQENLEGLVKGMKNLASENSIPIRGANVLDKDGNDIGDWYSTTTDTVIKLKNGKIFTIYAPTSISGGGGGGGGGGSGGGI